MTHNVSWKRLSDYELAIRIVSPFLPKMDTNKSTDSVSAQLPYEPPSELRASRFIRNGPLPLQGCEGYAKRWGPHPKRCPRTTTTTTSTTTTTNNNSTTTTTTTTPSLERFLREHVCSASGRCVGKFHEPYHLEEGEVVIRFH